MYNNAFIKEYLNIILEESKNSFDDIVIKKIGVNKKHNRLKINEDSNEEIDECIKKIRESSNISEVLENIKEYVSVMEEAVSAEKEETKEGPKKDDEKPTEVPPSGGSTEGETKKEESK